MQDHISNHARPGRLANKVWLGGLLLSMVLLIGSMAASAAVGAAAQHTTDSPMSTDTPTPTSTPTDACIHPPDIYEADNTRSQARPLAVSDPTQSHTFHLPSDIDWFRFDGLTVNRSYNVSTSNLAGSADTYMILYDQSDNIVKTNDDIDTARCLVDPQYCASTITWTATSAGPYFLVVRTLTYPPQDYPVCPCPGYDIDVQFKSLMVWLPIIIGPPSEPPPPTPTYTPTVTPTATPTQPAEMPTEIPLPQGQYPNGLAVNPDTHRVYVTSRDNDRLLMIDGLANTVIGYAKVGDQPWGVAVNRHTNKVYEANFASGNLFVLDGATLVNLETLWVGPKPTLVEINENTNTIFTITYGNESLVVINGNTDQVIKITGTDARGSWGLAVNPNLNRVYVSGRDSRTITTLDGANGWQTIKTQSITTDGGSGSCSPYELAFNPVNNKLYAACAQGGVDTALVYNVTANGLTLLARLPIGAGGTDGGGGVVVNAVTGHAFFTNSLANTVSVISGATDTIIATAPVGNNPFGIGVDSVTGRVFVGNRGSNSISVFQDPAAP